MRIITLLLVFIFCSQPIFAEENNYPLAEIKNFRIHSEQLSSAGLAYEQIPLVAKEGYQHVINLIPGDYTNESKQANSLGMSYKQIEVDWENPTLADFHQFAYYMHNTPEGEKTLVHCKLNYRASTFAYLYQVIVKNEPQASAEEKLLSVWEPTPHWLNYMNTVFEYYEELPHEPHNDQ